MKHFIIAISLLTLSLFLFFYAIHKGKQREAKNTHSVTASDTISWGAPTGGGGYLTTETDPHDTLELSITVTTDPPIYTTIKVIRFNNVNYKKQ